MPPLLQSLAENLLQTMTPGTMIGQSRDRTVESFAVRAKLHSDTKVLDVAYRAARKKRWCKELVDEWKSTECDGWLKSGQHIDGEMSIGWR